MKDKLLMCIAVGIVKSLAEEEDTADELFNHPDAVHMLKSIAEQIKIEFNVFDKSEDILEK